MKDKNRRGNNRRRNNRRREEIPRIHYPSMDCAICGEAISDMSNAIATEKTVYLLILIAF
jgi:hypothetical protein